MKNRLESVQDIVRAVYEGSNKKGYWEHTLRVLKYVQTLGRAENANMEVLLPAALLHDIGMTVDPTFVGHVKKSKILAVGILQQVGYNESDIGMIVKVIGSHHPSPGSELDSLEEKVLFDADNMEIIGVFGVLRWIGTVPETYQGLEGSIDLFLTNFSICEKERGSLFYTSSGRAMGQETLMSTVKYYEKLKKHMVQFNTDSDILNPVGF